MEQNDDNLVEINTKLNYVESPTDFSLDYEARRLNKCGVCKLAYNVGDRIPRILVNCGHTWCTSCLTKYFRKNRIRCPFCLKLVKNLENVEMLPLNINIFHEVVQTDSYLLDMIDLDGRDSYTSLCGYHPEKQKHFYCSFHKTNFCRECIKVYHRDEKCCVVDLFDINKLFNLHEQNIYKNLLIIKTRNKGKGKFKKEEFFIANS
jgi:hypothetical protein